LIELATARRHSTFIESNHIQRNFWREDSRCCISGH